jgi:cation transport ATPase
MYASDYPFFGENKEQHKGNQQKHYNGQKLSKSEYWKQYGKDKNYRKHSKDVKNNSEEDTSKSNVWKNYIKNKEENSIETSEDVSDSNDIDSPELENSSHNDNAILKALVVLQVFYWSTYCHFLFYLQCFSMVLFAVFLFFLLFLFLFCFVFFIIFFGRIIIELFPRIDILQIMTINKVFIA